MDFSTSYEDWENEAPRLAGVGKKNPFTVPDNYFKSLTENIEAGVAAERLTERVGDHGFVVPEGYFSSLQERISQRVGDPEPAKVRSLRFGWVKYAAAAAVAIAVSIGTLLNTHRSNNLQAQLNDIPENEIVSYLDLYSDASDTPVIIENLSDKSFGPSMEGISKEDLDQYLNSSTL